MHAPPWFRRLLPFVVLLLPLVLGACVASAPPPAPSAGTRAEDPLGRFLRMAEGALAARRPEAALSILERADAIRPGDLRVLRLQAAALLAAGRPGAAADRWRALLRRGPAPWSDHLGYVRSLVASGQARQAVDHLESVRSRFAHLAAWWNALGIARMHAGDGEGARAAFGEALARAPGRPAYTNNLALALALAGKTERARGLLRPLAEGLQSRPVFRHNLALVEVLDGRPQAARRILRIDLPDADVDADLARLARFADRRPDDPAPVELARAPRPITVPLPRPAPRGTRGGSDPRTSPVAGAWREPSAKARPGALVRGSSGSGAESSGRAPVTGAHAAAGSAAGASVEPTGGTGPSSAGRDREDHGGTDGGVRIATDTTPLEPASGAARSPDRGRGETLEVRPPAVRLVTPRLPPPVEALALDARDLARGRLALGEWVLRLGMAPDPKTAARRFAELARRFPRALGGLHRLADPDPGPQPLLVGPLPSRQAAEERCRLLRANGVGCTPLRL